MLDSIRDVFTNLKTNDVKKLCSDKVYRRGVAYFKEGRISKQIIYGNFLSGEVQGNEISYYHVKVRFENDQMMSICTCPYDMEEFCKHSISLLLNWIYKPEQFTDIDLFIKELEKKSREEILFLMERWIRLHPQIISNYPAKFERSRE